MFERSLHLKRLQTFLEKEWRAHATDEREVELEFGKIMGRLINVRAKERVQPYLAWFDDYAFLEEPINRNAIMKDGWEVLEETVIYQSL